MIRQPLRRPDVDTLHLAAARRAGASHTCLDNRRRRQARRGHGHGRGMRHHRREAAVSQPRRRDRGGRDQSPLSAGPRAHRLGPSFVHDDRSGSRRYLQSRPLARIRRRPAPYDGLRRMVRAAARLTVHLTDRSRCPQFTAFRPHCCQIERQSSATWVPMSFRSRHARPSNLPRALPRPGSFSSPGPRVSRSPSRPAPATPETAVRVLTGMPL